MRFVVYGAAGRMGQQVLAKIKESGVHTVAAAVDVSFQNACPQAEYPCLSALEDFSGEADCIIDFSHHSCTVPLLAYACSHHIPVMLATTGQTEEEKAAIPEAAKTIPVFRAANMSLGIAVLCNLVRTAVTMFPDADIEIVEAHHNRKLDVPSGTALTLADTVKSVREQARFVVGRHENGMRTKEEVGIHALRMGNVVGMHEVIINTGNETITLKHEAHDRAVFADGAVAVAVFLCGKAPGLYSMTDMIEG